MPIALITYAILAYLLMGWAFALLKTKTWDSVMLLIAAPITVWFVMFDYAKKRGK